MPSVRSPSCLVKGGVLCKVKASRPPGYNTRLFICKEQMGIQKPEVGWRCGDLTQPAVRKAGVPGNCLPVANCAPHAALSGMGQLSLGLGLRKNGFLSGVWLATGCFGHLYGEKVGGEDSCH